MGKEPELPPLGKRDDFSPEVIAAWEKRDAKMRAQLEAEEREKASAALAARVTAAEIPARALEAARAPRETAAIRQLDRAAQPLVLAGGVGVGKTVAAAVWLLRGMEAGKTGRFITAPALARVDRYNRQAMEKLTRVGLLVVDDLGTEYLDARGAYEALLDELLNDRYSEKRPTLITTNLDAEAFKGRYGERVADRIREAGSFYWAGSDSMRGKLAA